MREELRREKGRGKRFQCLMSTIIQPGARKLRKQMPQNVLSLRIERVFGEGERNRARA